MAREDYQSFTFQLHREEDKDLVQFLENGSAKTFIIKEALRFYKKRYDAAFKTLDALPQPGPAKPGKEEDDGEMYALDFE